MTSPQEKTSNQTQAFSLHMGIAEQGKVYALAGDHKMALLYYKNAMHLTVQAKDPELFFRHYLEAALESMEVLGYFDEVLAYAEKAIGMYEKNPPKDEISKLDLAYIYQKKGIALMKKGEKEEAKKAMKKAIDMMKKQKHPATLANTLYRWLSGGLHLDTKRILAEQKRNNYFSIRPETVDPTRAIKIPDEQLMPGV